MAERPRKRLCKIYDLPRLKMKHKRVKIDDALRLRELETISKEIMDLDICSEIQIMHKQNGVIVNKNGYTKLHTKRTGH